MPMMCGHVSDTCPCLLYSDDDIVITPPPPPLTTSDHYTLFAAEAASLGLCYFGGGSSSCDSPKSTQSGVDNLLVMKRSVSSHNGFFDTITRSSRREISSSSVAWSESNSIVEGMNKAYKYSPEEKKERIEKYRTKRNLRNFNKRIKYECRKTLADSRQRIRGRFAKNYEMSQHDHEHVDVIEDVDTWASFLDSFSANHFA